MERVAWERLIDEGETATLYHYFCAYRDTPREERNITRLAEKVGKSAKFLLNLSSKYNWKSRVDKYDDFVDKETRRRGLLKVEKIRLKSLNLSERMLNLAEEKITQMKTSDLNARETREYVKAALALAEVFKDDSSKQREYLEAEDSGADVIIYLPEIESAEED